MANAQYFSHSDNFVNSVSSNVDPRTGMYTCTATLGHNSENLSRGPKIPLMIGYSPFQTQNFGLGVGWAFNFSSYDTNTSILNCMNGENYTIQHTGDYYTLKQAKLTSLKMSAGSSWHRIDHGDGTIEILTGPDDANAVKVPTTVYSPTGAKFKLSWDSSFGPSPRITSITDDMNAEVLSVAYEDLSFSLTLWPGSDNETIYTGVVDSEQLQSLSATHTDASSAVQNWDWSFSYVDMNPHGMVLNQVTYPMGMVESVTYTGDGHTYPNGGPSSPLPFVTEFIRTPSGGGPVETFKYAFSPKNFLGGGNLQYGGLYDPTMDNLYAHAGDSPPYNYTSTTTHVDGDSDPIVTTRTYDTFHRLITELDQYQNNTSRQRQTTYPGDVNQNFDSQPNNYQLPSRVTTTYTSPEDSRSEYTDYAYDTNDGVRTLMVTPDNVRTVYDYYPASETAATKTDDFTYQCPASLSGRMAHIRTITITYPDVKDSSGKSLGARTELHEFAWDSITLPGGDQPTGPAPYAIVPISIRSSTLEQGKTINNGVKTKLRLLNITYVDSGQNLGRVSTISEQLPDEKGDFQEVANLAMSYTTNNDTFTETLAFTGYAATSATATASRSFCVRTGQMTQSVNELGVITNRAYDWLGRIQALTTASGTDYARITDCAYTLAKLNNTDDTPTLSAIISSGDARKVRVTCDGASRITAVYRSDGTADASKWPQIAATTYDALGRPDTSTIFDYTQKTNISTTGGSFGYDDWTINNLRQISNGPWRRDDFDPVRLQGLASWTRDTPPDKSGRTLTQYDSLQTPATVTRKTAKGNTEGTSTMLHDGRKRLRIHNDEAGNKTTAGYDDWNRPTTITLADTTSVGVTYDTAFTKSLPTAISINSLKVATRSYDGLGRVTTEAWGKQESKWTYDGAGKRPASHAITGGNTIEFSYVNALGQAISTRKVKDGTLSQSFTYYDKNNNLNIPAGLLQSATQTDNASGHNVTVERTYDAWGRLASEQITMDGKKLGGTATWAYTALGKPITYTDPTGRVFILTYDANGRLATVASGKAGSGEPAVSYTYDDASGRISSWTVKENNTTPIATGNVFYDDFGRETYRTIALKGGETITITGGTSTGTASNKYGPNSLIKQTSVLIDDKVVQQNDYTYDARLRLKTYRCSGASAPTSAAGPLTGIDYTYDACNNITAVARKTAGNTDTTTYTYVTSGDNANPFVLSKLNGQDVTSDAAGATTAMGNRTYTYDGFGRLASVTENGATIATYRYDALNRLICQTQAQGDPIYFFYAGDALASIVRAPNGNIAAGDDTTWLHAAGGPALERGPEGTTVIAADASGTVIGWAAPDQKTFSTIAWEPYGAAPPNLPQGAPMLGYNGHYRDAATGLQHLGNGYRPYDPATGRFLAPDTESPFGKGGHNPFAYCENDPVNFKDPTGHTKWWKVGLFILASAGALVGMAACGWGIATAATVGAKIGLGFLLAASASAVAWGVTGAIDTCIEASAASYDTPDSGSGINGAGTTYKNSRAAHKATGEAAVGLVTAGLAVLFFAGGKAPAGKTGAAATTGLGAAEAAGAAADTAAAGADVLGASLDALGAAPQAGQTFTGSGQDLAGRVLNDASQHDSAPTNQALTGSQDRAPPPGPSQLPTEFVPSGHPYAVAFTSDIFPDSSPARQRRWRAPTSHTVPGFPLGGHRSTVS